MSHTECNSQRQEQSTIAKQSCFILSGLLAHAPVMITYMYSVLVLIMKMMTGDQLPFSLSLVEGAGIHGLKAGRNTRHKSGKMYKDKARR